MKNKVLACLIALTMLGAGVVYGAAAKKCSPCKGAGRITKKENCYNCGGQGKLTCSTCKGKGTVIKSGALFASGCPDCKGAFNTSTGKVTCTTCNGKKKIESTSVCNTCKGWGDTEYHKDWRQGSW